MIEQPDNLNKQPKSITVSIYRTTRQKLNTYIANALVETGDQLSVAEVVDHIINQLELYREKFGKLEAEKK